MAGVSRPSPLSPRGYPVVVVVPLHKRGHPCPRVGQAGEAIRVGRAVLHGLELRLRIRIVVRHRRAAMRATHAQIDQQLGDRLGGHGRTAISVDRELVRRNALPLAGIGQDLLRQRPKGSPLLRGWPAASRQSSG